MNYIKVKPGDVVVTDFLLYQHWSIVTDKKCSKGKYMLISATKRTQTVKEESWDSVTQGKQTYKIEYETKNSIENILINARRQIDKWEYTIIGSNCESFVKSITGIKCISQVSIASLGIPFAWIIAKNVIKKPTPLNLLITAVCIGSTLLLSNRKRNTKLLTT